MEELLFLAKSITSLRRHKHGIYHSQLSTQVPFTKTFNCVRINYQRKTRGTRKSKGSDFQRCINIKGGRAVEKSIWKRLCKNRNRQLPRRDRGRTKKVHCSAHIQWALSFAFVSTIFRCQWWNTIPKATWISNSDPSFIYLRINQPFNKYFGMSVLHLDISLMSMLSNHSSSSIAHPNHMYSSINRKLCVFVGFSPVGSFTLW